MFLGRKPQPKPEPKTQKKTQDEMEAAQNKAVIGVLGNYTAALLKQEAQLNPDYFLDTLKLHYNAILISLFNCTIGVLDSPNDNVNNVAETMTHVQAHMEYALEQLEQFKRSYENYMILVNLTNGKTNDFSVSAFEVMLERLADLVGTPKSQIEPNFTGTKNGKYYANGREVDQRTYENYLKMKARQSANI